MQAKYLLFFRAVLLETLLLQILYASDAPPVGWRVWLVFLGYGALADLLYWLSKRRALSDTLAAASFLIDISFTTAVLFATGGFKEDLFIAYFLVILSTCFLEKLSLSFVVGGVACLVYGYLAYPTQEDFEPHYLLRLSLLLVTAFLSAYVVDGARRIQRETAERYGAALAWMERLSVVGRAMAAVLHEAKTPLGTIILMVDEARARVGQGEDPSPSLDSITEQAERTVSILSNFLDFTKASPLELVSVELERPLQKALEAIRLRTADRGLKLTTELSPGLRVLASERHLIQAFSNVMMNGIEAMPLGGELLVRALARDGRAEIVVRDTGVGMTAETQRRLFEPFFSGKPDTGHGIGLTVVRWIVERHRGSMQISSEGIGKGATVRLDFPLAPGARDSKPA